MESWSFVHGETVFVPTETIPSCEDFVKSNNDLIDVFENNGLGEIVFQELIDLTENENESLITDCEIKGSSIVSSNSVCLDDDSKSGVFRNIVESREPSFVDLKLGRFDDVSGSPKGIPVMLPSDSFRSTKRMRMGKHSRPLHCVVFGCRKDLSSSKDYHRRHKVCEVHSKAASVIVNGRIQRFCQQCSRFHLLAEFDNGKRSCRKRLQDHNERRRKPQAGMHSAITERLIKRCDGSMAGNVNKNAIKTASSICERMLPGRLVQPELHVANESIPTTERDPQSAEGPRYGSCPSYQKASPGSKELSTFRALTTCQSLSKIAKSSRALSLLSTRYLNSPSHSSRILSTHYNTNQVSEQTVMMSSPTSNHEVSDQYVSSTASSTEEINFGPILTFEAATDMDSLSSEDDATIDWLQLSSHLQRVEQQKQSVLVKRGSN